MMFYYIVIIFTLFFVIVSMEDITHKFVFFIFVLFITYQYYIKTNDELKAKANIKQRFSSNEDGTHKRKEIIVKNVYNVHQSPKKFKYIYFHEDIMQITNDLSFMKTFDKGSYEILIVLLEKFLKIYYYMLDKRYPCNPWHQTLMDLRAEILNLMQSFHHNIPERSKKYNKDTRRTLEEKIIQIQAITFKCLKVITHKCNKMIGNPLLNYKSPLPFDKTKNNMYDLF
jgi:hypothetical protein